MDNPGTSGDVRRSALLIAHPPPTAKHKTKSSDTPECVVCGKTQTAKNNHLRVLTEDSWKSLAAKALKWKDTETEFENLHQRIKSDEAPKHVHKVCRLNVVGSRLTVALKGKTKSKNNEKQDDKIIHVPLAKTVTSRRCSSRIPKVPNSVCIFCLKRLDGKTKRDPKTRSRTPVKYYRVETEEAWKTFAEAVKYVEDTKKRDRLQTLATYCNSNGGILKAAAMDIRYHKDCWFFHCRSVYIMKENDRIEVERQNRWKFVKDQQANAFQILCSNLETSLVEKIEVFTLRDVLSDYESIQRDLLLDDGEIRSTCNDSHALKMLRSKLEEHFGDKIGFHTRYRRNESPIVFFPKHGGAYVETALNSWGVDYAELTCNLAKILHDKYRNEPGSPWPCRLQELELYEVPDGIYNLVALLANPTCEMFQGRANVSDRIKPSVRLISEIIMHLITGKRQPLQVTLSMSVHNLTGSKELLQLLKKLRLGISYNDVLDQLSAWALDDSNRGSLTNPDFNTPILQHIAPGIAGAVMMDNDDFNEDGLTGSETSHYTNVMMVQRCSDRIEAQPVLSNPLRIPSAAARKSLIPAVIPKTIHQSKTRSEPQQKNLETHLPMKSAYRVTAHALVRILSPLTIQPAFTGYHCTLKGNVEKWQTYNIKSFAQPPSIEVVKATMDWCQEAAVLKEMPIIQFVADQAVYKYIEEIYCSDTERWSRVRGVLGGFHTETSFLNAIGKRYAGSGLAELAVSSGVVAAGSVERVLSGKHYKRGMRLHKLLAEALIRMMIQRYIEKHPFALDGLIHALNIKTEDELDAFVKSQEFQKFFDIIRQEAVSADSDMAAFWLSYINDVETLFQHYHCLRSGNNFNEYLESCRKTLPLLAAYNNINYLRYLSLYYWRMSTLSETEKAAMSKVYSVSLTGNNYSGLSPDQVIEMTMNKQSKNRRGGGWIGITKNVSMITIQMLTRPLIMHIRERLHAAAMWKKPLVHHPELGPSRMEKDKKVVSSAIAALHEWDTDPWDVTNPTLRSLCTGEPASSEVTRSLSVAHKEGNDMVESVLNRLSSGAQSIHAVISKRKNNKTFAMNDVTTFSQGKSRLLVDHTAMKNTIELLTNGNSGLLTLEQVMQHRVTEINLALFTSGGCLHKPVKSSFIETLTLLPVPEPTHYNVLVDVGMIWNRVPPADTWSHYARLLYIYVVNRHPGAITINFINDVYNPNLILMSTKQHEQQRRALSNKFAPNVYPAPNQLMPTGKAWRLFLSKAENKHRLQKFLLSEWGTYCHHAKVFFTMDQECYSLGNSTLVAQFACPSINEADSRAFFHAARIQDTWATHEVVLDFEDTDVWMISAFVSHQSNQQIFMYKKVSETPHFYNSRNFFPDEETASIALAIYTFTGVDTVSGFFGCGKVTAWKRTMKSSDTSIKNTLNQLGKDSQISPELLQGLEMFTIRLLYNDKLSKDLAHARARKWRLLRKSDSARLPPDTDSFKQHCLRAHLQVFEWRHSRQAKTLQATKFGWELLDEVLHPVRHTTEALPEDLRVNNATDDHEDIAVPHSDEENGSKDNGGNTTSEFESDTDDSNYSDSSSDNTDDSENETDEEQT